VQAQSFTDLEIIVIDDGSTDNTPDVVKQFRKDDDRIVYIQQENRGPSATRNTGIKNSHGKYIAFLDSDDLWGPEKIKKQLLTFEQYKDIDVVYVNYANVDINGCLINYNLPSEEDGKFKTFYLYEKLLYFCAVTGSDSSVMAKREAIIQTGFFDESLHVAEDWDYWRRMALHSKFYFLDEYLLFIRRHENTISQKTDRRWNDQSRHLKKMYLETPNQYRFHLPETAYLLYTSFLKNYIKQLFSRDDFHGVYMSFFILTKIISLGYKYPLRLVNDAFRAYRDRKN